MSTAAPSVSLRRNIAANYVGRVYSMGANYVFIPFYVGILGIEAYGVIVFYTLLLTITGFADVGMSATFSREAARHEDPSQLIQLLASLERVLLCTVAGCSLLILAGSGWLAEYWLNTAGAVSAETIMWPLRLMALMLVPQLIMSLYLAGLLGLQRQVEANVIRSLFVTVRGGLVILPILWRPDLTLFFAWQLAATLAFTMATRIALVRAMGLRPSASAPFRWSTLRPHLPYAGGMMVITVIAGINTQFDKAVISRLFTLAEFGYYSLASTLAQLPVAAATPIAVAFFPALVADVRRGEATERSRVYKDFARSVAFVAGLGGFGLALFAPELLALWLQDPGLPTVVAQLTATMAIGSLFLCLATPPYYLCLAHGQSWLVVTVTGVTLIVTVPAAIVAIGAYGLWGGALFWLSLNLITLVLLTVAIYRRFPGMLFAEHLRVAAMPLAFGLLPLLGARIVADRVDASPLLGCALAGTGAAIAAIAFAASRGLPRTQTNRV